jgi:hypothetical protein
VLINAVIQSRTSYVLFVMEPRTYNNIILLLPVRLCRNFLLRNGCFSGENCNSGSNTAQFTDILIVPLTLLRPSSRPLLLPSTMNFLWVTRIGCNLQSISSYSIICDVIFYDRPLASVYLAPPMVPNLSGQFTTCTSVKSQIGRHNCDRICTVGLCGRS